jgi:hypothetical protein
MLDRTDFVLVLFFENLIATTYHSAGAENILQKLNTSSSYQQPKNDSNFLNFEKKDLPTPAATNQCMCAVCYLTNQLLTVDISTGPCASFSATDRGLKCYIITSRSNVS